MPPCSPARILVAALLRAFARRVDPQPRYLSELSNVDLDVLTRGRKR